jgi:hypothetical protein
MMMAVVLEEEEEVLRCVIAELLQRNCSFPSCARMHMHSHHQLHQHQHQQQQLSQ